jgi:hypothetical protein
MSVQAIKRTHVVRNISHIGVGWNCNVVDFCVCTLAVVSVSNLSCDSFVVSNFRCILNVLCYLPSGSPASELYMPTFRNTAYEDVTDTVFQNVDIYNSHAGDSPRRKPTFRNTSNEDVTDRGFQNVDI